MAKAKGNGAALNDGAASGSLRPHARSPARIDTAAANEESRRLLIATEDDDDEDDIVVHRGKSPSPAPSVSSLRGSARARSPKTPRSANRVRFDLRPEIVTPRDQNGTTAAEGVGRGRIRTDRDPEEFDMDEEDYASSGPGSLDTAHRRPLLTDIEAPSVAVANSPWGSGGDVEDWAEEERRRPKSGLRSAFMNMANSIIGAGIIGMPYAFRQAGLLAGLVLLIGLTVVVDWTIRLIVVNSKLSGSNSFQATVQHCYGNGGLIAISIAQWAFAFGGMVAFGVIVGDSIPHVLTAIWPGLSEMPIIGLLADRRVVIVIFVLGISYPLTLYRDIAKVRSPGGWDDGSTRGANVIGLGIACKSEYPCAHQHDDYSLHSSNSGDIDPKGG